jgi:hypothetical protein
MSLNENSPLSISPETVAALYTSASQMVIHSQENKNFTLYNFLMFNSFLLVGWATLFSSIHIWLDGIACTLICLIGLLASIAWESLGRNYVQAADSIRGLVSMSEDSLPLEWPKFCQVRNNQITCRKTGTWIPFKTDRVGSGHLLIYTPRVLAVGYCLFIGLSWLAVYLK